MDARNARNAKNVTDDEVFIERQFFEKLRRLRIAFDSTNVVVLTSQNVPWSLKLVLSLGPKFSFLCWKNDDNFPLDILQNALDRVSDGVCRFEQWKELSKDIASLREDVIKDLGSERSEAQIFIRHQADLAGEFLRKNPDIMIMPADKGGKVIILDEIIYDAKVREHLDENLKSHVYFQVKNLNIGDIRNIVEPKFEALRMDINRFLLKDVQDGNSGLSYPIESEPYIIAQLVVLLKAHKEGMPPRPIVSAPEAWGKRLSEWLLTKLELISKSFGHFEVKSSEEFIKRLKEIGHISGSHKLANWDYSSMFTNIPFPITKRIISDNYSIVAETTSVPLSLFIEAIAILVEHSSYFYYAGEIYRQTKGLTMGNRLSKILAEITTNYFTMKTCRGMDDEHIRFIFKYVDDFIGAMGADIFSRFEGDVSGGIKDLKVIRTDESESGEITFLDILIKRDEHYGLLTRWWQKDCSVQQILNYHSFHPRNMKESVVREFIRHALVCTSPVLYQCTIKNLRKTLRRSSYPMSFIDDIIKVVLMDIGDVQVLSVIGDVDNDFDFLSEIRMRAGNIFPLNGSCITKLGRCLLQRHGKCGFEDRYDNQHKRRRKDFISFPFTGENMLCKAKSILRSNYIECRLAPSVVISNRFKLFSNAKGARNLEDIKFGLFALGCLDCDFQGWFKTDNLDLARTLKHVLLNPFSLANKHLDVNVGHRINDEPVMVKTFRNKFDLKASFDRVTSGL